ncbi:unnamed protein product [Moneuplotes crassus]|uniref:Uncharacterized protein n=1 Tax=Euplotes crassus TaxID=5936 RepID=A0AAD1U9X3_EUPCR|nr:unnamed protein product [Moneuplotes crassus]
MPFQCLLPATGMKVIELIPPLTMVCSIPPKVICDLEPVSVNLTPKEFSGITPSSYSCVTRHTENTIPLCSFMTRKVCTFNFKHLKVVDCVCLVIGQGNFPSDFASCDSSRAVSNFLHPLFIVL